MMLSPAGMAMNLLKMKSQFAEENPNLIEDPELEPLVYEDELEDDSLMYEDDPELEPLGQEEMEDPELEFPQGY